MHTQENDDVIETLTLRLKLLPHYVSYDVAVGDDEAVVIIKDDGM